MIRSHLSVLNNKYFDHSFLISTPSFFCDINIIMTNPIYLFRHHFVSLSPILILSYIACTENSIYIITIVNWDLNWYMLNIVHCVFCGITPFFFLTLTVWINSPLKLFAAFKYIPVDSFNNWILAFYHQGWKQLNTFTNQSTFFYWPKARFSFWCIFWYLKQSDLY